MTTPREFKRIQYPHITRIERLEPNANILLGKPLTFTEKRDGTNCAFWINDENKQYISSRNTQMREDAEKIKLQCPDIVEGIFELISESRNDYVIYAEFIPKGKGPTRIEDINETPTLVVFDILSYSQETFLPYVALYQQCYHFKLPCVERYAETEHSTMESLLEYRDKILSICKENKREGVVIKWVSPTGFVNPAGETVRYLYVKEKLDIPPLPKLVNKDNNRPIYPPLPETEVRAELAKLSADIGINKLKDTSIAMPELIRRLTIVVKEEYMSIPKDVFKIYSQYISEQQ